MDFSRIPRGDGGRGMAGVVNADDGVGMNLGAKDVQGDRQVYGSGPARRRGFEGIVQHLRDSLRTVDGLRVFAKGRGDGDLVLKMTESRRAR